MSRLTGLRPDIVEVMSASIILFFDPCHSVTKYPLALFLTYAVPRKQLII